MEVKEKIRNVLVDVLKVNSGELKDEGKLYDDMGVDSTEVVEIITALEKTFSIGLNAGEVTKFSSIDDIEGVIKTKLGK
jgi:acyl carrier protein